MKILNILLLLLICSPASALVAVSEVPDKLDPGTTYVFYLHGRLIENQGPRPTHPEFGLYDYPGVVAALGTRGAVVITEQRPAGTDVGAYAQKVLAQIEQLIERGVPPANIAVVGFSKGGAIALYVSSFSTHPQISFLPLAICGDWLNERPDLRLTGRVLSIYEASDEWGGSCQALAERAPGPASFSEIKISTGLRHGAFYRPLEPWTVPVLSWLHD